jgi:O-antigen/teichoic acid export membrane protein
MINDKMPIRGLFTKILCGLAVVAVLPVAVITVFGPQLFSLVFGQNWGEAGIYARIISPWLCMTVLLIPASAIMVVTRRQRFRLIFYVVLTGFQVVIFAVARLYHLNAYTMLTVISIGSSAIYAYKLYYSFRIIKEYERSACLVPPLSDNEVHSTRCKTQES